MVLYYICFLSYVTLKVISGTSESSFLSSMLLPTLFFITLLINVSYSINFVNSNEILNSYFSTSNLVREYTYGFFNFMWSTAVLASHTLNLDSNKKIISKL